MASFFGGLNRSTYAKSATQYLRGASLAVKLAQTKVDASTPPSPKGVGAGTLGLEVAKEFGTVDPLGLYFVFTSNFPAGANYCAWHGATSVNGKLIAVAYVPNTSNVAGCNPGNLFGLAGSEGLRSLANVSAHEFMESITDTVFTAWRDSSGSEIADKCAWQFVSPVTLANGSRWQLQEEWSNAIIGCVQATP